MNDSLAQALDRLPHGPEFRFIDRLTALEPGRTGSGEFTVPADAAYLKGHFPGQPMLPGVLLVEAAAQLAGTVAQSDAQLPPLPNLKLTALRNIKILGAPKPGDVVKLTARVSGRFANLVQAEVSAHCEGRVVLQGSVTLSGGTGSES
ncbi:MAG TPA: FabA/FabZ family ACP-dehydratase [Verrucomicrobiae bacterium]|nr:FabA/FabZ family ACP-dehydratase [Verrucomicrobiae bacterium]